MFRVFRRGPHGTVNADVLSLLLSFSLLAFWRHPMELLIVAFVLGVILAIVAVLATWLALGNWTVMWRAMLAIVGASGGALLFCATSGERDAEWLVVVWVIVITIAAMFVLVRWLGFKLVDTTTGSGIRSDEMQFSLVQLMALTAVVAAIAAAARMLAPLKATMMALTFGLAIAICLGALALVTVWAILQSDITRSKLSILAIAAIVMAGLVYCGMEATNADPGLVWGAVVIVYTIALAGSLLLARRHGFRLQSNSDCNQPTARRATEPSLQPEPRSGPLGDG